MITTICQFARTSFPVTRLINRSLITAPRIYFPFSEAQNPGAQVEATTREQVENRAANFYRNSIRRININDKGRGKFTEHHLLRLIKLTERAQEEPLLYEAYYNYLGHFTIISSTTVDKLLLKALSFSTPNLSNAIEIFANHNYLGYFPHYKVTAQLLQAASSDENAFHKLLDTLLASPLIKFDSAITEWLLERIQDPSAINTTVSLIIKLLAQRDHYHLLTGIITRRQLLSRFVQAIQARLDNKTFKPFRRSNHLTNWCADILSSEPLDEQLHYEIAVLSVTSKDETLFGDNLILIKDNEKVLRSLLYLEECPESFTTAAVKYLNGLNISEELKVRLEEFKPTDTDPTTVGGQ